jgi:hypothetical protein
MPALSYCLHQAQVCLSLARGTDDPKLKQRYGELAVDFVERAGGRREAEIESRLPSTNAKTNDDGASPPRGL